MEIKDFYSCLFDANEGICISSNPRGVEVNTLDKYISPEKYPFISINPLDLTQDRNPSEIWHCARIPRRADINVSVYRNILIEMDKLELDRQLDHMRTIELPYSTCVFSGGKSYHWIISLKEPLSTRVEYNRLVARIYQAVGKDLVDQACKNPSRFSRVPGHFRADKKALQELIAVNGRIDKTKLEDWLISKGVTQLEQSEWEDVTYYKPRAAREFSSLSGATKLFLQLGKDLPGGWNIALFKAAADLCRNGWDLDGARDMLLQITGTLDQADDKTIKSAFSNEINKKEEYNG